MKMGGQEVPIEFVNDIVALHFRKEEFEYRYGLLSFQFWLLASIVFFISVCARQF